VSTLVLSLGAAALGLVWLVDRLLR